MGFQDAIANGLASVRRVAGTTVSYHRDALSVVLTAAAGTPRDIVDDYNEVQIAAGERDWLIASADLVLDASPILPVSGDRIHETVGVATYVWEVLPIDGETCFIWSDATRTTMRVHTKRVRK